MIEKKCNNCLIVKPLIGNFYKQSMNKGGYNHKCNECVSKTNKLRYNNKYSKIRKLQSEYYKNNKEKIIKRHNVNVKKRYHTDATYKLRVNLSRMLRASLLKGGFTKTSSTYTTLGCTYVFFVKYLENNDYGFKVLDENIDVDHIIPISSAKTKKEVIRLSHYSNFQLLPSDYNRIIKKDKLFDKIHFDEWIKAKSV